MDKLFMVGLGGKAENANIEVHDIQFVIGQSIEDTLGTLKSNWYGIGKKLHMDSYKTIIGADGYQVIIIENTTTEVIKEGAVSLFLVNVGGYDSKSFLENHRIGLFIGETPNEARAKAKKLLFEDYIQPHIDNVVNVNDVLSVSYGKQYSIRLHKTDEEYDLSPEWFGYRRLDIV